MDWIKEHISCSFWLRLLFYLVAFAGFVAVIFLWDIRLLVYQIPHYNLLKSNLDFLALIVSKYGGLIIAILLIVLIFNLVFNFRMDIAGFNLLGITFSLKNQEDTVKSQIRTFLNTKRSIFYFRKDYDNIYDVMKSWYEILNFVRLQFSKVEGKGELSKECDEKLQDIVLKLNEFLTKYQSDYRRWFEWRLRIEENKNICDSFTHFIDIQKSYDKYHEMLDAIIKLNEKMWEYGDYFGVNYSKWTSENRELERDGRL